MRNVSSEEIYHAQKPAEVAESFGKWQVVNESDTVGCRPDTVCCDFVAEKRHTCAVQLSFVLVDLDTIVSENF